MRTFLLVLIFAFATTTVVSSCAKNPYYTPGILRLFTSSDINTEYSNLKTQDYQINNILSGTNKYNNGNYILIIGSIADPANNELISTRDQNCEYNRNWEGALTILENLRNEQKQEIALLVYEDIFPKQSASEMQFPGIKDSISLDAKYFQGPNGVTLTNENLQIYANNPFLKYTDNNEIPQVKKEYRGKYVRNDQNAKDYRRLFEILQNQMTISSEVEPIVVLCKENPVNKTITRKDPFQSKNGRNSWNEIAEFYKDSEK